MLASFHKCCMMLVLRASMYSCEINALKKFQVSDVDLSGPVELLILLCLWSLGLDVVSCIGVACSLLICLFIILCVLHVVFYCAIEMLVESVICLCVIAVLLLNVMVFCVWVGVLLP